MAIDIYFHLDESQSGERLRGFSGRSTDGVGSASTGRVPLRSLNSCGWCWQGLIAMLQLLHSRMQYRHWPSHEDFYWFELGEPFPSAHADTSCRPIARLLARGIRGRW